MLAQVQTLHSSRGADPADPLPNLGDLYNKDHIALSGKTCHVIGMKDGAQKKPIICSNVLVHEIVFVHDKDNDRYLALSVPPNAGHTVLKDMISQADPNPEFKRFCDVVILNEGDYEDKYKNQIEEASFNVQGFEKVDIFPKAANRPDMSPRHIVFMPESKKLYVYRDDGKLIGVRDVFQNKGSGLT